MNGNQQSASSENSSMKIDRLSLIKTLSSIPQEQLLQIIFALKPPSGIIPPNNETQGKQVSALLQWAESPSGCGLEKVEAILERIVEPSVDHIDENLKIEELKKDIERLSQKYRALKEEARNTRDPDAKIDLEAKAEKIYDELTRKKLELN